MTLPTLLPGEQNTGTIPSTTYTFDQVNGRISRTKIDQIDAIKQMVRKTLQSNRYQSLIYSFYYGTEIETLVGKQPNFVLTESARMIREALIFDDRILNVINFKNTIVGDSFSVTFTVQSIFGQFEESLIIQI